MQRAGPVSPKPQDRPGKTWAAPRTTLSVGPASPAPALGVLSVGQVGRSPRRRTSLSPFFLIPPPPRPQSLLSGPRPSVDQKIFRVCSPGERCDPRAISWIWQDVRLSQSRASFVFFYFEFVGGKWQTPGVDFKERKWSQMGIVFSRCFVDCISNAALASYSSSYYKRCSFIVLIGAQSIFHTLRLISLGLIQHFPCNNHQAISAVINLKACPRATTCVKFFKFNRISFSCSHTGSLLVKEKQQMGCFGILL